MGDEPIGQREFDLFLDTARDAIEVLEPLHADDGRERTPLAILAAEGPLELRQTPAVGRHESQRVARRRHLHAVEDEPGRLLARGERGLLDQRPEVRRFDPATRLRRERGDLRVLRGVLALELEKAPVRVEGELLSRRGQGDLLVADLAQDAGEELGGHDGVARLVDRHVLGQPAANRDLEVGADEFEAVVRRGDLDALEYLLGALPGYRLTDEAGQVR